MKGFEDFIEFVHQECKKHKIIFKQYKRNYVKFSEHIKCCGFFQSPIINEDVQKKGVLAIASCGKYTMPTLVHEYSHMTQWLEEIPLWEEVGLAQHRLNDWLSGKRVKNISSYIDIVKDLELDNEKRSVELIKNWDLPIDIDDYIKEANLYVLSYLYLKDTRKFYIGTNSNYALKKIMNNMSNKFDMNYEFLEPDIKKLFKKHTT